jgi:hypothetical protein
MRTVTRFGVLGLALAALAAAGCGPSGAANLPEGDPKAIGDLIDNLNEVRTDPKRLAACFARGAAPKDLKRYAACEFYLGGKPSVSGDSATLTVSVRRQSDGGEAGTPEWTLVKEGSDWKLKSAPLP